MSPPQATPVESLHWLSMQSVPTAGAAKGKKKRRHAALSVQGKQGFSLSLFLGSFQTPDLPINGMLSGLVLRFFLVPPL